MTAPHQNPGVAPDALADRLSAGLTAGVLPFSSAVGRFFLPVVELPRVPCASRPRGLFWGG